MDRHDVSYIAVKISGTFNPPSHPTQHLDKIFKCDSIDSFLLDGKIFLELLHVNQRVITLIQIHFSYDTIPARGGRGGDGGIGGNGRKFFFFFFHICLGRQNFVRHGTKYEY